MAGVSGQAVFSDAFPPGLLPWIPVGNCHHPGQGCAARPGPYAARLCPPPPGSAAARLCARVACRPEAWLAGQRNGAYSCLARDGED
eukprot:15265263-Alexandrium_andersonii.AAC.1